MSFQGDSIYWVEVEKIVPNPFQPRREFDEERLRELADSIRMYGVLQPLTVTRKEVQREDGTFYSEYELIAGERRLRASKLAGVSQVPVIIREGEQSEQEKLELAIIENLQREDLNAVDRALAFRQLADVFGLQHTQVAKKVGRSREYVSNSIRLLNLPEYILSALRQADISEGHARTLLMLNDRPEEQDVVFREILLKKLSVREVERIARNIATDKVRAKTLEAMDATLIEMEKQFTETLGTRVQIQKTDFGGKLTIDYFSLEDLEVILERVRAEAAGAVIGQTPQQVVRALASHTPITIDPVVPQVIPDLMAPQTDISSVSVVHPVTEPVSEPTHTPLRREDAIRHSPIDPSDDLPSAPSEVTPIVPVTHMYAQPAPVNTTRSTLVAALDRALGRTAEPKPVTSAPPPMVPAGVPAVTNLPPVKNTPPVPAPEDEDLYSLKNFSI